MRKSNLTVTVGALVSKEKWSEIRKAIATENKKRKK